MELTKKQIQDNKKNSVFLAGALLNTINRIVKSEDNKLYIYNNPIYKLIDIAEIDVLIFNFFTEYEITDRWKSSVLAEMFRAIKASASEVKFNNYENLICFNNIILNMDTVETKEFSDEYFFTTYVDIKYDPTVKEANYFLDFLKTTFTLDNGEVDKDTMETVLYISAYLLYPKNIIEQMFLFLGDGANGKSVLIELYKMFFPKDNITSISLTSLAKETGFLREKIITSRVNFSTEAKGREVDSEEIKKIISGETIVVDRKNKPVVEIDPQCKIIIATNSLPYFADTSHGINRRLVMIEFKNLFTEDDSTINNKKRIFKKIDKHFLLNKLKREKSAILNIFIIYLQQLKLNKWIIPESANALDTKKEYTENADVLGTWLKNTYDILEEENYKGLSIENIYNDYKYYYESNVSKNFNIKSTTVGKKIQSTFRIKSINARDIFSKQVIRHYQLIKK